MIKQVRYAILAAGLSLFAGTTAGAQAAEEKKPGGLNKIARNVSKTAKKAGRDTKAEVKRGSSKAHNALTDAGNDTKAELKRATGIKAPQSHEPGGLNKVARDISNTSKKAGSDAKAETNRAKSHVHGELTEAGKSVKDTTLKTKP
jgi:Skp family chaperone for outer membrane proteins